MLNRVLGIWLSVVCFISFLFPSFLFAQAKGPRELRVPYPLGGSTSYFWVAYRSGSFDKYGLKIQPIYIRGGRAAVQALLRPAGDHGQIDR